MPRSTIRICFFIVIWILAAPARSQTVYGFEWIRSWQPYLKIKIAAKGLYRLDSASLAAWGNPNPARLQLFRNGIEQPLYIQGGSDNLLNGSDFVEFLGAPQDGTLDTEMYRTTTEQPHTFRSQFNDTAIYFLTLLDDTAAQQPLRMQAFADSDYGNYLPEPQYLLQQQIVPQEEYYYGTFIPASEKYYISEYGDAEGMMSYLIGQSQNRTYYFNTRAAAAQAAEIKIKVLGASDFYLDNPNLPNHHLRIYAIANNGTPQLIADTTFRGYGERIITRTISASLLGDSTGFLFEVVNDIGVLSDFVGVSYLQLSYYRQAQWSNTPTEFQLPAAIAAAKNLIQLSAYTGSDPVLWNTETLRRVSGSAQSGNIRFLIPYQAGKRSLWLQDGAAYIGSNRLSAVTFNFPDPSQDYQYIIVSNRKLAASAESYRAYRSQQYKTLLVYAEDLCNAFTYGQFHPLAISRFCSYMAGKQTHLPAYLLLLGRGYQNNLLKLNPENIGLNLVPALGVPSSDHLFTLNIGGNSGAPGIATGRIPANTDTEVMNYLNKLIYRETHPDSIDTWHKHFLHLSGGDSKGLQDQFRNQLAGIGKMVTDTPNGAFIYAYGKSTTASTDNNQATRQKLVNHLNSGINMMTFYGHGSLTVLDMDFGTVNDLQPNNKCTFYYFNGCNIGNANDADPLGSGLVYGKDYICAANKGAIGWLAHSNLTFTNQLEYQMNEIYSRLKNNYGASIGKQLKEALQTTTTGTDPFARSHALQLILQGDPALRLYSPVQPDYAIAESDIFINPANANVQDDSLQVGVVIHNRGKAIRDTLTLDLSRTLPDNSVIQFARQKLITPLYQDTFYFTVKPLLKKDIGINTFQVTLNKDRKPEEFTYSNNTAQNAYFLPGSGIQALLPANYGIVKADTVTLSIQNNNLFAEPTGYVFEMDTSLAFSASSAFYKQSGEIISSPVCSWTIPLKGPDSMVYYWRAKLNLPENEGGTWVTSSFVNLKQGPAGWHQQRYEQLKNASARNLIVFTDTSKSIEFAEQELVLGIENRRFDHRGMGVTIPYLLNAGVGTCISQGTVALVFEPFQVDIPYELPNYPFNCAFVQANKDKQSIRYYPFNTNTLAGEQELAAWIDSIPNGYYVAMFSRYATNLPNWQPATKAIFSKIGSVKIAEVKSYNTAWGVIGLKGEAPGMAVEDTVNNNDLAGSPLPPGPTDPPDTKYIRLRRAIMQKWFTGTFTTAAIGPAVKYENYQLALTETDPLPKGKWWLDILGSNAQGKDTVLRAAQTQLSGDLSFIDAAQYPKLKLRLGFTDSTYRTPHQVKFLQVNYEAGPELSVHAGKDYAFYAPVIDKGDTLRLRLPVINLGNALTDTTSALITLTDQNRIQQYADTVKLNPLNTLVSTTLEFKVATAKLRGAQTLQVNINQQRKPAEANYINNYYKQNLLVKEDVQNPYMEVTFDGVRIMNGDIVSPEPRIVVSSTDQNKFLMQKDTGTFELYLRKPKTFDFERIPLNSAGVTFVPAEGKNEARLIYKPGLLPDGTYTLRVKAKDASGNAAGNNDYEIDFKVINKSAISEFYPYPNPFTTHMRFVFTLTGSKIPDEMLIRIMTVNGKVVREIGKDELGHIHAGNNVSEFAWDGTDMYGDKLANGVYLYKVYVRSNGSQMEHYATSAKEESSFFVNGTGKIYLMR